MSAVARLLAAHRAGGEPLRVLSASGQLGFGIPEAAFKTGIARRPHFIGCDMGSVDPGPYYLGSGRIAASPPIARRDLEMVLLAARALDVPLTIGSAGTAGAAPHLQATLAIVRDIARQHGLNFRLATIESDIPADTVIGAVRAGRLAPLAHMPAVTEQEIRACSHVVGQCGTETFRRAFELSPDVVIAGRACDTAVFSALPEMLGYAPGECAHMAKIVECTSLCCTPGGRDAILALLDVDGFVLESMNPARHATPASVAAHALYEQTAPFEVIEPTGRVLLDSARYSALDAHRTRVSGARWLPATQPSIKIEGALRLGERAVLLAGSVAPTFIAALPQILRDVEATARAILPGSWQVFPHGYGLGAIRALPAGAPPPAEVGLVIEFIAEAAELALAAAAVFRQHLLHHGFPGRVSTAGNIAFAFTPPEFNCGAAYRFALYHVMQVDDIDAHFRVAATQV